MSWKGVRTVAVLELRQRVRATRWRLMLAIWAVVLALVCGGLMAAMLANGYHPASRDYLALYDVVVCFVLGIGLIVAPTLSAMSINGDRADATLALLQATALRAREIAVGKLLAAWLAAMTFLAVALPFLAVLALMADASPLTLLGHALVLLVTLGSVCAIGLGMSGLTARTSASAVLTYLVVAVLVVGTPLATAASTMAARGTQRVIYYEADYDASTDDSVKCEEKPHVEIEEVIHTDRIWWMLTPNPFLMLADISARDTRGDPYAGLLKSSGLGIDEMRNPQPAEVVHYFCDRTATEEPSFDEDSQSPQHLAFWPAGLLVLVLLGTGGVVAAVRRLEVPAGRLPKGVRLA
ncbi:ABC transporter permease [Actinomyces slackii]|uniref:ABC-type transport system involved in multi-copper enzyme maturation, permease component n=1 Tax=Actinomyces slackii TaxID=52774 RepID=A0A3S4UM87_9ACTO|nr:membrane protein [Actinomyces slackii]VEG73841.1 ABC-type transport system involved in multi-copper enzyme maturation, permease component [Actinomyces slackii]